MMRQLRVACVLVAAARFGAPAACPAALTPADEGCSFAPGNYTVPSPGGSLLAITLAGGSGNGWAGSGRGASFRVVLFPLAGEGLTVSASGEGGARSNVVGGCGCGGGGGGATAITQGSAIVAVAAGGGGWT